jgi:hypothetical protein
MPTDAVRVMLFEKLQYINELDSVDDFGLEDQYVSLQCIGKVKSLYASKLRLYKQ